MISLGVGLAWLFFFDKYEGIQLIGFIFTIGSGGVYFYLGVREMIINIKLERKLERESYKEMLQQLGNKENFMKDESEK